MSKQLITAILLMVGFIAKAQTNDAGMWTSLQLEHKWSNRFSSTGSAEFRFNENYAELGSVFGEAGLTCKYNKQLDFSITYRYISARNLDNSYSARHRIMLDAQYKRKISKWTPSFRLRYQSQIHEFYTSSDWMVPVDYIRSKAALKYDTDKKYTPSVSFELFTLISGPESVINTGYRMQASVDYDLSKKSSVEAGYLIDHEFNVADPVTGYILTLGWSYKL